VTGRGGMKILFPAPKPKTVNTSAITLSPTASLGSGNTVHIADELELPGIVTADVNEKCCRNDFNKGTKPPETNPLTMDTELPHLRPSLPTIDTYTTYTTCATCAAYRSTNRCAYARGATKGKEVPTWIGIA
jgi:hypothetical protein